MWRLKVAEGGSSWLRTTNDYVGRQVWDLDPDSGSQLERDEVNRARQAFRAHRFQMKHSADLLMRLQFAKLNPLKMDLPVIKLGEKEKVTEGSGVTSLRRAISRYSTLQTHNGHWAGDYEGPMFLMPGLNLLAPWPHLVASVQASSPQPPVYSNVFQDHERAYFDSVDFIYFREMLLDFCLILPK